MRCHLFIITCMRIVYDSIVSVIGLSVGCLVFALLNEHINWQMAARIKLVHWSYAPWVLTYSGIFLG